MLPVTVNVPRCGLCMDEGFHDAVCPVCDHPQVPHHSDHVHDFIDATNAHVSNTALCPCGFYTRLDEVELTTKSLDELREAYPDFPWRKK